MSLDSTVTVSTSGCHPARPWP